MLPSRRVARAPIRDESTRTPGRSRSSNKADQIERWMKEDHEDKWGPVIYRCTYNNDSDWQVFLDRYRHFIRYDLELCNGLDVFDQLEITVIEDKQILEGASPAAVREHFKAWSDEHYPDRSNDPWYNNQRVKYCIRVDDACVRSVIKVAQYVRGRDRGGGFVDLVWKNWVFSKVEEEEGEFEGREPIAGIRAKDVGFMHVSLDFVLELWGYLRHEYVWENEYRRPPYVTDGDFARGYLRTD
ncbi:unnamed protein product [Cercospora beticola]|nr:unnamed protein product [Cercospora beticola]